MLALKEAVKFVEFWENYLPKLEKSIRVKSNKDKPYDCWEGVGCVRDGYRWNSRTGRWLRSEVFWYTPSGEVASSKKANPNTDIPLFPNYVKQAIASMRTRTNGRYFNWASLNTNEESNYSNWANLNTDKERTYVHSTDTGRWFVKDEYNSAIYTTKENKTMSNFKNTANSVLETNKEAVKLSAKLSVGKTANSFFLSKLASRLPWYAKLFGKKKEVVDNPIAKLVTAELATTLATHFAGGNEKLIYISEAMLQEAMVDLTVNSEQLKSLISELEDMVTLPQFKE